MAGYVSLGVGGVGLALGTVFGLQALSKRSDAKSQCPAGVCASQSGVDAHDGAKTAAWVSDIGFGLGLAGAAIGTYLLLTPSEKGRVGAIRITPMVGSQGAGAVAVGAF